MYWELRVFTFLVIAFGRVPNCGASAGRSTGLLMSDGTDSVLRILVTTDKMKKKFGTSTQTIVEKRRFETTAKKKKNS